MVMVEVNQLANDLPRYQSTLTEKIHNLRDTVGRAGLLKNASSMLKNLDRELKAKDQGEPAVVAKPSLSDGPQGRTPIRSPSTGSWCLGNPRRYAASPRGTLYHHRHRRHFPDLLSFPA
jgi:hypothetical protein